MINMFSGINTCTRQIMAGSTPGCSLGERDLIVVELKKLSVTHLFIIAAAGAMLRFIYLIGV